MKCSVLLVEDDPGIHEQLAAAIREAPDLQLVGNVTTLAEAQLVLPKLRPHVLLVDLGLPDGSGLELIRMARRQGLAPQILVLTAFGDHRVVMECLQAGATGYLLKGDTGEGIAAQIRALRQGGRPISPTIARKVLDRFFGEATPHPDTAPTLSQQELTVLLLCAKGCTYEEIAGLLHIRRYTVDTYMRRTFRKLHVHNRAEAVYEAQRMGLIQY